MPDQAGVGGWANAPQQDEVKVILIRDDLKLIPWQNPSARPNALGDYKLASLACISGHIWEVQRWLRQ